MRVFPFIKYRAKFLSDNILQCFSAGRNFLNRALLSLSYSEIVRTLKDKELFCSSGFSLNVGWRNSSGGFVVSNFEISSEGAMETQYKSGYGYHFNM